MRKRMKNVNIESFHLFVDNISVVRLIKNPELQKRRKHIDVKYHFVRDLYLKSGIDVKYVKSENQTVDIFTKALPKPRFMYLREMLGFRSKSKTTNLPEQQE